MSNAEFWESESARRPWFDNQTGGDRPDAETPHPSHIETLRDTVTHLVPLETTLGYLAALREPTPLDTATAANRDLAAPSAESYLDRLDDLQHSPPRDGQQAQLQSLESAIRLKRRSMEALFWHLVYPALGSRPQLEPLVSQMRDRSLRREAEMQRQTIAGLCDRLPANLSQADFDLLSEDTQRILGTLLDIERRQRVLERLVLRDRTLPAASLTISIVYILVAVTLVILYVSLWSDGLVVTPLGDRKLALIGIPWPVLVWSLFGSLAAIVARCVYRPFRRFGETVQWLLLRPIQGVVLGAASYFVVESLLLLLTQQLNAETPQTIADEAILLLSFLVGLSDRFGAMVFRWMSEAEGD